MYYSIFVQGQPLGFLVLFRAMWALEEFNQSGNFRQRGSVNQILPKCNRLSFTGIVLNDSNFLFPSLSKERAKRAKKLFRSTAALISTYEPSQS